MIRVLTILGTRPEAIKLWPLIAGFRERPEQFAASVCSTGQHREMLDQVLLQLSIQPDHDLRVMTEGQTLPTLTARILAALEPVIAAERPDLIVVQGDTTTTLCGALGAFYARIPLAHVEAGLRTFDRSRPFPEEMNRVLVGSLAELHFAATPGARANLLASGVPESSVFVTGNTGIDAVLRACNMLPERAYPEFSGKRLILVTAHRRESFGEGMEQIARAIARLANRPDVQVVYPVHRNPNVLGPVQRILGGLPNVLLLPPQEYIPFIGLMREASIILTDSGGIQEEAPALGKPVIVLRETTERPEAVVEGTAELTGTDPDRIVQAAERLLDDPIEAARRSRNHNRFGDGQATERIIGVIASYFEGKNSVGGAGNAACGAVES